MFSRLTYQETRSWLRQPGQLTPALAGQLYYMAGRGLSPCRDWFCTAVELFVQFVLTTEKTGGEGMSLKADFVGKEQREHWCIPESL